MSTGIDVIEEYLFPTMVWSADISGARNMNRDLLETISTLRKEVPSIRRSNELGWHSPTNMHTHEGFALLGECIGKMAETIATSMKARPDTRLVIRTLWININPKYAWNALHEHPESILSGVYYVQADEKSGCLRFRDPRAAKRMSPWPIAPGSKKDERHWDRVSYQPKPGRMIMFPSWLAHDVEANMSEKERISISFNLVRQTL